MATKDDELFLTNDSSNARYTNLNLNQNQQYQGGELLKVQVDDGKQQSQGHCYGGDEKRKDRLSWNQSESKKLPLDLSDFNQNSISNKKKDEQSVKGSTLSLHIEAYENNNISISSSGTKLNTQDLIKKYRTAKEVFEDLTYHHAFEFPRQQENGNEGIPEVRNFKATQKLLDPNATTTSATQSPNQRDSDLNLDRDNPPIKQSDEAKGIPPSALKPDDYAFNKARPPMQQPACPAAADEMDAHTPPSTATAKTSSKPMPLDNKDESPPHDSADENIKVMHIDHTALKIPAELKKEEIRSLLKSMKKTQKIQAVYQSESPTSFSKVLTYCTDDDITLDDRSARETADDLSGSGKPTEFEALLMRLISHGPRQYSFNFDELQRLLKAATKIFANEPSLLECPVPCTVYGDIHGHYSDLHRWFNLNGWPHQTRTVFLGNLVDRGSHGVEVIALLSCLKLVYPDNIFIVRGNHEEESLNRAHTFYDEVICRFSDDSMMGGKDGSVMYDNFKNLFFRLPLAVLIGGRVLGMHGGLSPKMESLQTIRGIKRPVYFFKVGSLECDLVWSDPDTAADTGFRPNLDREPNIGIGQLFAANTVKETCDRLNIDLILRGHQVPRLGYSLFADGRMMTLFSAPGAKGTSTADVNMGACIEFDKNMKSTVTQIKVSERFRQNRIDYVEKMKVQRKQKLEYIEKTQEEETAPFLRSLIPIPIPPNEFLPAHLRLQQQQPRHRRIRFPEICTCESDMKWGICAAVSIFLIVVLSIGGFFFVQHILHS